MTPGLIFRECLLFSSIKKQSYEEENYEISKYTNNIKTDLHLLMNDAFSI